MTEDIYGRIIALPVYTKPQRELLDQYIAASTKVIEQVEALKVRA